MGGIDVMNNISSERINKLIYRYVLEIFLVILFLIISFLAFTTTSLSNSALVAETYDRTKYDLQVLYGRTNSNKESVLQFENLLDRGELEIKNPNMSPTNIEIKMIIEKNDIDSINELIIDFDDIFVDMSKAIEKENTYELIIETTKLDGYSTFKKTVSIYGDPLNTKELEYTFKVTESFYN